MDTAAGVTGTAESRRAFWISLAALVVVLPAAIAVQCWDSVAEWRAQNQRDPVDVAANADVLYAGASWKLTRFTRLSGGSPDRMVVLVEFEARPGDPAALVQQFCEVLLQDSLGRQWEPAFIGDPVVKRTYPAAGKPGCAGPTFEDLAPGEAAQMAATFTAPATAVDLKFLVTIASARPAFLRFSEPRN